tara:strand:- start:7258 stop:8358 length:1101 start_codon:yes stop_codon:yes gene_type:complete
MTFWRIILARRVVIVGAGIMGLLTARWLAAEGVEVVLLDKQQAGKEASWAGGGIVSPLYPWRYHQAVTQLVQWSQAYYPELAALLNEETGIDPEYCQTGLVMSGVDDLELLEGWCKQHHRRYSKVDGAQIRDIIPGSGVESGYFMPDIANIRNPRLLQALLVYCRQSEHITLLENTQLLDVQQRLCGGVTARINTSQLECDNLVFCTGAWTRQVLQQWWDTPINIEPVKGQMIVLDGRQVGLSTMLLHKGRYLIPRKDGKILVGSTLEHNGFDKQTTKQAKESLLDDAIAMLPALASCEVLHHWAGLRPGSHEGIPYISSLPGKPDIFVNAGHYRNGLVLAPAATKLLTNLLLKQAPIVPQQDYSI